MRRDAGRRVNQDLYYRTAQTGRPLILTKLEKAELVELLKSLTSKQALGFRALLSGLRHAGVWLPAAWSHALPGDHK